MLRLLALRSLGIAGILLFLLTNSARGNLPVAASIASIASIEGTLEGVVLRVTARAGKNVLEIRTDGGADFRIEVPRGAPIGSIAAHPPRRGDRITIRIHASSQDGEGPDRRVIDDRAFYPA